MAGIITGNRSMKKYSIVILFLIFILFLSCTGPVNSDSAATGNSKLVMTFSNISSMDFNNITVSGRDLGSLKMNHSKSVAFDSFGFDTGMPDEDVSIKTAHAELNNYNRNFWCGTEKVRADSGDYTIKINVIDSFLVICCDNPPLIEYPDLP